MAFAVLCACLRKVASHLECVQYGRGTLYDKEPLKADPGLELHREDGGKTRLMLPVIGTFSSVSPLQSGPRNVAPLKCPPPPPPRKATPVVRPLSIVTK